MGGFPNCDGVMTFGMCIDCGISMSITIISTTTLTHSNTSNSSSSGAIKHGGDGEYGERGNTSQADDRRAAHLSCGTTATPSAVGFGVLCHGHKCACGFVKDDFIDVIHGGLP